MKKIKIGILREERIPTDRRVALLPSQCIEVIQQFDVDIVIQPSDVRCFSNKEYLAAGLALQEDLSDCDILIGIKEVPTHLFIANKTYLIFSHTIKKQAHNKKLLQTVLERNVRLIDYEALTDVAGNRIIAFGHYAGLVGAYNGLLMYGKRYGLFQLKRAYQCFDIQEVQSELKKVKLPPIKIAITGGGRVANGCMEILDYMGIKKVSPLEFIHNSYSKAVYTQLHSQDYHTHKEDKEFSREEFLIHPERYASNFSHYYPHVDLLIASAYWNPQAPVLFTKEEIQQKNFNIKVIADITCDIGGSIPSTIRPSTIDNPAYDFNRYSGLLEAPFSDEKNITVMAIDNLPGELPRNSSEGFGIQLMKNVLPSLLKTTDEYTILSGTITNEGKLTPRFQYLEDYVE